VALLGPGGERTVVGAQQRLALLALRRLLIVRAIFLLGALLEALDALLE
jgi:hypothetical protein